uniref:Lipocalin n=1 Tax=Rhipicephalus zambeziensis TaxID=60191 RepID=A0A224YBD6_9ACAR
MKSGIFSTIVCGILVVSVWPSGTQTRKVVPDIKKFLNPGEIVWVLVTSAERGPDCQLDIIDTIVAGKVYFRRLIGYKFTMSDFQQFLEGHLQSSRKFRKNISDVLNVGYRGAAPTSAEKLLYLSQQYNCGVFEVKGLPNGANYELRSKNPSTEGASNTHCFKAYNKTARGKGRRISVDPHCEDILKGNNDIVSSINMASGALG